jgi:outer membrane biosynthesis protein TonB
MVGLFLWRKSQAEQPIVVPSPSASAAIAAAHAPHDEPIDIPPPPPIVPDAAPDTPVKPTGAGAGGANWGDGCAQTTCGGRITPELSSALAFRAKTAHRCYDEALAQDPTLKGQVVLSVKIGNNGNVCSASVERSREPQRRQLHRQQVPPGSSAAVASRWLPRSECADAAATGALTG